MKRLACLLMAMLMTLSVASAEEWCSIADIRAQTPARWTQTYETKWRTINIDAEIRVPEVDTVPVILIEGAAEQPSLTAEETGWDRIRTSQGYDLVWNNPWPDYPSKLNGKRLNSQQEARNHRYGGFHVNECYVPMSDTTLGELCTMADRTLIQFGIDPQEYMYQTPFHMWSQHMFFYGKKQNALPGTLFIEFHPKLAGIPVLSHIFKSVYTEGGMSRDDEYLSYPDCRIVYHGYGEYMGTISLWRAQPVEVLAKDIPLCSFDTIRTVIEAEISAGHVRKIYEIELGYVLYNEPGKYHAAKPGKAMVAETAAAQYYLRPMWLVNCLYKDTATGKLRSKPSDSDDERNTLDYYQLLIDAQTGEAVKRSNAQDRCEYKGFISWEDVQ